MGTRSLTYFYEGNEKQPLSCFYRQMDGYPSGHGQELANFLKPITVVNGYGMDMKAGTHANGAGCLTAQVIAHFKNDHGIGGIYIQPAKLNADSGQEYEYEVVVGHRDPGGDGFGQPKGAPGEQITLRVFDKPWKGKRKLLWEGFPKDYDAWLVEHEKQEAG